MVCVSVIAMKEIVIRIDLLDIPSKNDLSLSGLKDLRIFRMNSQYRLGLIRFI